MPRTRLAYALIATLAFGIQPAGAATFNLATSIVAGGQQIDGRSGGKVTSVAFSSRQVELLGVAESFWETVLTGFTGLAQATVSLTASMAKIDGRHKVAAYAGPTSGHWVDGRDPGTGAQRWFLRADAGRMQFDADDFGPGAAGVHSEEIFLAVAIHEISHVLGYGTAFRGNGLIDDTNNTYVGREAVSAFNRTYGSAVSGIPLDALGQHWSECWASAGTGTPCQALGGPEGGSHNDDDVLTPFVTSRAAVIRPASIAMFRDLGFLTIDPFSGIRLPSAAAAQAQPVPAPSPVPLPAGGLLLASALVAAAAFRARR